MTPLAELAVLASVGGSTVAAGWLAVTEVAPEGSDLATYVFGGGATAVLAAVLAEVARRLMNGSLIARQTKDVEAEMNAYILAAGQREDRAMKAVEDSSASNAQVVRVADDLRIANAKLAEGVVEVLRKQHDDLEKLLEDVRDEVRELRRGQR